MKKDDSFIQIQVEDVLKNAGFLRSADIKAETRNGEVTLYGFVDVLAEKWAAGDVVEKIPGVASVDNSLTVAEDRHLQDNEIASQIQERFCADPRIDLHQLTATVKEGVVYLEGEVGIVAEERVAKELAARTRGVKEVISYLNLGQGAFNVDDPTIVNSVATALSRSTEVSARDVETDCRNGWVTLAGNVDTPEQVMAAEKIVAQVPGVKKIINNLVARNDGANGTDYSLTNAIRTELGNNGLGGIRCFVVDGTVFLEGAVGNPEQKHQAEQVVSGFRGINGINNDILIG
ncbi:MAG: BON domain-containing protein [Eubacteriales bacterium]